MKNLKTKISEVSQRKSFAFFVKHEFLQKKKKRKKLVFGVKNLKQS